MSYAETQRRFCRVVLQGDEGTPVKPVLLTVQGESPILLTNDGHFVRMHDVKMNKEHFFNTDKIVHIQLEEEREVN